VANKKSAIKRIKIAERNRIRNKNYKSSVRTLMKKCFQAVESFGAGKEKQDSVDESLAQAYSKIDKAVKKGVLHANTGARKKSRLARALNKVSSSASA